VEAVADLTQQPKITLQPEVIPARVMEVAQRLTMVVQAVTDLAQVQGQAQAQEREPEVTAAEEPERAVAAQPLQA
jgi:phage-related minor tail protein